MELRFWLRPALVSACAFVLTACESGSEAKSSEELRNQFAVTIAGSVGDGPAVGADVVIRVQLKMATGTMKDFSLPAVVRWVRAGGMGVQFGLLGLLYAYRHPALGEKDKKES